MFRLFLGSLFLIASVAAQAESPIKNVLFMISDDLKASALGCYGDALANSPNIDALAKRSMVFERAYCQGTWCLPSRKSFMHSRYQDIKSPNLGELFRGRGVHSARVGKIFHMRVPGDIIDGTDGEDEPSAWDERYNCSGQEAHTAGLYACLNQNVFTRAPENRQSTRMPHRPWVTVRCDGDGSDQPDVKAADQAIELLREHGDQPFFLAVGFVRPHYPMVAPGDYFDRYPITEITLPHVPENDLADIPAMGRSKSTSKRTGLDLYPDNQKRMWQGYYATIEFMDQQLGRILDELDRQGLRDSTAIVFTSDHGYHLGEHTFWQKVNMHEEVTRVPLMVSAPGYEPGRTRSLAELVDIYPTVAELCGIPQPSSLQGKSLTPVLGDASATVREAAFSLDRGHYAIREDEWAYMKYKDGTTELYNMVTDPNQFTNLSNDPRHATTKQRMEQRLARKLKVL
ncbi:MAG: sulfatase [Planctomycetota bacterium]